MGYLVYVYRLNLSVSNQEYASCFPVVSLVDCGNEFGYGKFILTSPVFRTKKKEMWFDFQQTTFHKTTKVMM